MPDRALRLNRRCLFAVTVRDGLNASNARQGIKTPTINAHRDSPYGRGLNASNARQGIKTPLRPEGAGRVCLRV